MVWGPQPVMRDPLRGVNPARCSGPNRGNTILRRVPLKKHCQMMRAVPILSGLLVIITILLAAEQG